MRPSENCPELSPFPIGPFNHIEQRYLKTEHVDWSKIRSVYKSVRYMVERSSFVNITYEQLAHAYSIQRR